MRPIPSRLPLALLLAAAGGSCTHATARLDVDPPAAGGEIRVRVRPGGSYLRVEDDTVGVLRLLNCPAPPGDVAGRTTVGAGRTVAFNATGDSLIIPAGGASAGTAVEIVRRAGRPYRWVAAAAGTGPTPAALTVNLGGCARTGTLTVVRWTGSPLWDDVGGTVAGSSITVQLPHLSIYALAGG